MSRPLPAGTVTVLFTDIEDSSRKWDEHRSFMAQALVLHHQIVTAAIEEHGGVIVKDKGDGFFAAFADAESALAAAVEAQRSLGASAWPDEVAPVLVRMALHTGQLQPDDGDYRGPVVNRVARLEGAAHGGQVVVSDATRALVADSAADDISFKDLGPHLLRGMSRPERVHQVTGPGLMADFPALRTEGASGTPLPSYPTSFVGRDRDLASIEDLIDDAGVRLVTLLGPGGIGKTRLAVEAAQALAPDLNGRTYFADLASIDNPADVGLAVAEAVGAHAEGGASPLAMAAARCTDPTLLVLDNFEHVHEAATHVAELVDDAPLLKVLATSRSPLNISGERVYRVEPLGATNGDGSIPPAVALFYDRARGHGVELPTEGPELAAASAIAQRLDGLPLAIELVAARTRLLSVVELRDMLGGSLDALGSGAADLPQRQRTIRATIEWSFGALSERQQQLFARISVFPAGATRQQLAAVSSQLDQASLLDDLAVLVDNSLVTVVTGSPGGTRYRQLVLLRDYGREHLAASGLLDEVMGNLVDDYMARAAALGPALRAGEVALGELRVDHANLLAAMSWSVENGRFDDMVWTMGEWWPYWFNGDLAGAADEWLRRGTPEREIARHEFLVALMALQAGDGAAAVAGFASALERFDEAGDVTWAARCATFQSFFVEDPEMGLALATRGADHFGGSKPGIDLFMSRLMVSSYHFRQGDVATAIEIRSSFLDWAETAEFVEMRGWAHWNLAIALLADGQVDRAHPHVREALAVFHANGYQEGVASAADLEAVVAIRNGRDEEGLRILGGSDRVWDGLASQRWPESAMLVDAALAGVTGELGDDAVRELMSDGRRLGFDELVELARSVNP